MVRVAVARNIMTHTMTVVLIGLLSLSANLLTATGTAWAHAHLAQSDPADGAVLSAAPDDIEVVFTETIEAGASRIVLLDEAGQEVAGTSQAAVGADGLRLALPALSPGAYRVSWTVLSRDGHTTSGQISFVVEDGAPAVGASGADESPAAAGQIATAEPADSGQGRPNQLWIPIAAILVIIGVLLGRRRR